MDSRNTCRIVVGRLVEIQLIAGFRTTADVAAVEEAIGDQLAKLGPGSTIVIAADWRPSPLLTPEVAERARAALGRHAARIERSGILRSAAQPTSVMQVFRLIKEAPMPDDRRRVFTDADAMCTWLGEVLTPAEVERLREFLELA